MKEEKFEFTYRVYPGAEDLPEDLRTLMTEAREVTEQAYAPYSRFKVGAIARMGNGEKVAGTNQENASFPLGLCAERVLLAAAASIFPKEPIDTIAISYRSDVVTSDHPVSPCGLCRQALQEFEMRGGQPIQLLLGGIEGPVYLIDAASKLLPLAFTSSELTT
jgi:cytidine deaminase